MPIVDISGLSKDEADSKKIIRCRLEEYFSEYLDIPKSATTVTFIDDETADQGKNVHVMARVYSQSFMDMPKGDLKAVCEAVFQILEEEADHDFHEVLPIPILMIHGRYNKRVGQ